MIVIKFGGTSVQDAQAIGRVISIVEDRLAEKPVVVVSALARVTRLLVKIAEEAKMQNQRAVSDLMAQLRERHVALSRELISDGPILADCLSSINSQCDSLSDFAEGVCRIGELSLRSNARIISTGEMLSSTIIAAAMNDKGLKAKWLDARRMIITNDDYMSARPDMEETEGDIRWLIPEAFKGADVILTQGFVASTKEGSTSVLGFEGSDYSAAIFGMALRASRVEIWTDVDGIRTADPRVVDDTCRIEKVSYEEAASMAWLGARVLHPLTIEPARSRNIPIYVKNSYNIPCEGSAVVRGDLSSSGPKSIAFREDIDYLEVRSRTLTGTETMTARVMDILTSRRIKVCLLNYSQALLCLTLEKDQPGFDEALSEISALGEATLYRDKAQLSVVGKDVVELSGLRDTVRSCAGKVAMIHDDPVGMSESYVVDLAGVRETVKELHKRIFGK